MRKLKIYAWALLLLMGADIIVPTAAFALTGGPGQPEFSSFTPIGTSEMVNLPSGDFVYNIPLMDVGGYPLNLAYNSGITTEQEASFVGLGWSLNPGAINRNIRSIPDDFKGQADAIKKEFNLKPNRTVGLSLGSKMELFGIKPPFLDSKNSSISFGVNYNNYKGYGSEFGISPAVNGGKLGYDDMTASIGVNIDPQSGIALNPKLGYDDQIDENDKKYIKGSLGLSINSREGLSKSSFSFKSRNGKEKGVMGTELGGSHSFSGHSFSPEIGMPMNNLSMNFKFSPNGVSIFGSNLDLMTIQGYYSQQKLRQETVSKASYGMFYAHEGYSDEHAIMDFSREKDGAFHPYSTHLPVVNGGSDILSVTGQGMAGSFQLKRSDIPMFYDVRKTNKSNGGKLGIELGKGSLVHIGTDFGFNHTTSISQKWEQGKGNRFLDSYNFQAAGIKDYEPAYYKAAGEMAVESDMQHWTNLGTDGAVEPMLSHKKGTFKIWTEPYLADRNGRQVARQGTDVKRDKRERRNSSISQLTAHEASIVGLNKKVSLYEENDFQQPLKHKDFDRVLPSEGRHAHHLSQMESVRSDGMRYVYGIPAYNLSKREVSFNASGIIADCSTGNVQYDPASDNSVKNELGDDNYFNALSTPAYAHSYLLTEVLSQDYEDLKGDGPTADDYGSYTKLNYVRTADIQSPYKWRTVIQKDQATFNPGLQSKKSDNQASYAYGTKELYFVHSIESKTMIAEFTYEKRKDAFGVEGENGGLANINQNRSLSKITLYSLADRKANGNSATPIKTVHFVYDYSLCPNTPNSTASGKLTLKEVYFTYGHSKKGRLSSYRFGYKSPATSYSYRSYDRWGDYKPNATNLKCENPRQGDPISNEEFPYAEQNENLVNTRAGTWSLNNIKLPSGGEINVEYEAKHYGYVQDRPAMEMTPVTGIGAKGKYELYDLNPLNTPINFLKVYFQHNPAFTPEDYLKSFRLEKDYVYLRCYVLLNSISAVKENWEYVTLFSKITNVDKDGDGYFVELEILDGDKNQKLNPISKWSFQFIRQYLPSLAYGEATIKPEDVIKKPQSVLKPLGSTLLQVAQFVTNFNTVCKTRGYARYIDLTRSHIRLTSPDGVKYGGGSMVKEIRIKDNWDKMTGQPGTGFYYGQTYSYTKLDDNGRMVSSGVASNEPQVGGDENPFREPYAVKVEKKPLAIDNVHFTIGPLAEGLMPSPQIVFSEIKVKNLEHTGVQRTATGHSVMKYYTAKDFPTIIDDTALEPIHKRINPLLKLLGVVDVYHEAVSQGFLVKRNNMHGQSRAKEVYDENASLISSVNYFYKSKSLDREQGHTDVWELDNEVEVLRSDGKTETRLIGTDVHMAGDSRESKGQTTSAGLDLNADGFLLGPVPVTVPVPVPSFHYDEKQFRSTTMTKVIDQYGVLEKVVAYDLGSEIATKNHLWDAETGEVLLTETFNEFEDPIFNLKFPAHLAYEGMSGAYKNIGLESELSPVSGVTGAYVTSSADLHMPGDELHLTGASEATGWVLHVDKSTDRIYIIDRKGLTISGATQAKVIRSGHRNMPMASIGSITSKENPLKNGKLNLNRPNDNEELKVLNAGAVEYSDEWQSYYRDCLRNVDAPDITNPFVQNIRGNWKPKKSWLQLQERDRDAIASTSSNTYIRENGAYDKFTPFWDPNNYWKRDKTNWTWTTEVTKFNPNGTELENVDILKRHSCEVLGYYDQLVTGVAANARYQEVAFDGFEDYYYNDELQKENCPIPKHFGADINLGAVSDKAAHTGNYSLGVRPNNQVKTTVDLNQGISSSPNTFMTPYRWQDEDIVKSFSPTSGVTKPKKYVVTAWVKEGNGMGEIDYVDHRLTIDPSSSSPVHFAASGMIIDGWQRLEGIFEVKPADSNLEIIFKATGTKDVYFDDLRIFPYDADMKSFVYDDISLKLVVELDANAYATFYEYDASGELIRIKKETERGIMTIQESRSAQPKNP